MTTVYQLMDAAHLVLKLCSVDEQRTNVSLLVHQLWTKNTLVTTYQWTNVSLPAH